MALPRDPSATLVISDLDGTLLTPGRRLGRRTVRALHRLQSAGGHFTVATGRSAASAAPLLRQLQLSLPAIVHNGAMMARLESGEIVALQPMNPRLAAELYDAALCRGLTPMAYALPPGGDDWHQVRLLHGPEPVNDATARYLASVALRHQLVGTGSEQLERLQPLSMILLDAAAEVDDFLATHCGEVNEVRFFPGRSAYTPGLGVGEITAHGASKARAAAELCRELDLGPEDVVAFGDNHNDLELLRFAGTALCPQDADAEIRAQVRQRVPATEHEGVAQWLEAWLDGRDELA